MNKVIYLNSQTNEEVHYGEYITFHESGTYKNGGKWSSELSFPIVNETIPMLIKKGILVQKEVEERTTFNFKERKKNKGRADYEEEYTVDDKLEILRSAVNILFSEVKSIKADLYEDEEEDND